ncbi:MAG: hypothetical protein KBC64_06545 [Simkaniaceae bacterium]|nr:hypothetical protein [Simkaniaceae bacterium]
MIVCRFLSLLILFFHLPIEASFGLPTYFPFSNEPIDVVIPTIEKDLAVLNLCIDGIRKNGANIRRIIVVSKKKLTDHAEWYSEEAYPFSFQEVAEALAQNHPQIQSKLLETGARTGWYYQQLLKFYAPLVIPDISSNVLILDSDTVFLNPVTFLNDANGGMYNPGEEYHPPYFKHAELLIPGFYKVFPKYSGIVHHMLFQKAVIETLFNQVESTHCVPFWKAFCQCVEREDLFYSGASEYEIYFNYVFSCTKQGSLRKLKWKNITDLRKIPCFRKKGFHYVSIHSYNRK